MKILSVFLFVCLSLQSLAHDVSLNHKMKVLDTKFFESFNHCQNPKELEKHASFFSPDVEFYHDSGGVTWDRESMISNTKITHVATTLVNLCLVHLKLTQLTILVQ